MAGTKVEPSIPALPGGDIVGDITRSSRRRRREEPEPQAAAEAQPAPAPAAVEKPAAEPEAQAAEPAAAEERPARKRAAKTARAAAPAKPRRRRGRPLVFDFETNETPTTLTQVREPNPLHMEFKIGVTGHRTSMQKVLVRMTDVWCHDPQLWQALFAIAADQRKPPGELLRRALRRLVENEGVDVDADDADDVDDEDEPE